MRMIGWNLQIVSKRKLPTDELQCQEGIIQGKRKKGDPSRPKKREAKEEGK
jgi:hypothetical protein